MSAINKYVTLINGWIDTLSLPSRPEGLYEPVKYMLAGGGKRLRPTLLCATAEAFGLPCENVRPQALGIEMFHNFTLLHDDVMDNADVRHGKPTVHNKWNVSTAILSGDTMLTLATILTADCPAEKSHDIMALFNRTAIEIYEGQQYDMNFELRDDVTLDEYVEMIRLKTAVLLGCACREGALMAGASADDCDNIYRFGELMGLAFQLRDDYLDTFGDPATFGKEIGGDILNDKKTWLRVKTEQMAPGRLAETTSGLDGAKKIAAVSALYRELGVDKACMDEIERYTNEAIESLECIELMPQEFKQLLKDVALSAVKRNS